MTDKTSVNLGEAITSLEEAGYIILPGEAIENTEENFDKEGSEAFRSKDNPEPDSHLDPSEFYNNEQDLMEIAFDSVVPACCKYYCEVEPDGYCYHGNPSILLELNLI